MGLWLLPALLLHWAVLNSIVTMMLALTLVTTTSLACYHPHHRRPASVRYLRFWWVAHILLSFVVLALMSIHVFYALAY